MKQRSITPREQRSLDQLNAIQRKVAALDDLKMLSSGRSGMFTFRAARFSPTGSS